MADACCARAPVIASYVAYYFARTDALTNYGTSGNVAVARSASATDRRHAFQLSRLKGKWVFLCGRGQLQDFCQRKLFTLRQLRLSQGKDMARIERAWLITTMSRRPCHGERLPGHLLVRAAGSDFLKLLPAQVRLRTTFTWSIRSHSDDALSPRLRSAPNGDGHIARLLSTRNGSDTSADIAVTHHELAALWLSVLHGANFAFRT